MSAVTCQACQKTTEPFGDFGAGGIVWRCGNVECAAPIVREDKIAVNGETSVARSVVVPIRPDLQTHKTKEAAPRSLDTIADELRARRVIVEERLTEMVALQDELAKIDLMLGAIEGIK